MRIVFRLNYHTVPGQSIWLRVSANDDAGTLQIRQCQPMQWINDRWWELALEVGAGDIVRLEYSYQLRQESNGVELDEWGGPRRASADPERDGALLLWDTWCSAGGPDYAYRTSAFRGTADRGPFADPEVPQDANHTFQLRMAAVPDGLVPCLIGSVGEIGDWDWTKAVPLDEVDADVWQASLYLPADWGVEYKYGLWDPAAETVVTLECGENRFLDARVIDAGQQVRIADEGFRRDDSQLYRAAGVAIPVFSLRSADGMGVGEFADLKPFADWAASTGLKLIQILPINDTTSSHDWTDSYPYSAISVTALHPIYLRLHDLPYEMPDEFRARMDSARDDLNRRAEIDYEGVMAAKLGFLRAIYQEHGGKTSGSKPFRSFLKAAGDWVVPYAAFCVLRDRYHTADFSEWGDWKTYDRRRVEEMMDAKHPDSSEIKFHIWLQFELDRQLSDAVGHLHQFGLALKGDLPIGIDRDSVDAWESPQLFKMDAQAGAPPDAFAVKGQNWGFPTYNWEVMREDGYAWWRARFARLSRYFDAFRIDHILGFFRIWQVPSDQIDGIMGWFDPALPIEIEEIRGRGIDFRIDRFCEPHLRENILRELFAEQFDEVCEDYIEPVGEDRFRLRPHVSTQRKIVDHFAAITPGDDDHKARLDRLRDTLLDCASEVLFFEVPGSNGTLFHPRCGMHDTRSFRDLDDDQRWRIDALYIDYFFRRQEPFWEAKGYEKLPVMRRASPMLLCGEDLGMVPACVPGVLRELGILSLEIQRMPKRSDIRFADPADAPYMSVVSPSTHDMPTLRGWWREDPGVSAAFAWQAFGLADPPPELSGELASRIIVQHLESPSMWAVFPLQDLLAMDEELRHPDPDAERINVPAIMPYYWRYRMHLPIESLAAAGDFNGKLRRLLADSGR